MQTELIPVIEKHSVLSRITHWLNVPLLWLMIWSGCLIYWADPAYLAIPDEIGPFRIHHRLAEGMGWHFFIMWAFLLNGIIYLGHLLLSGEWRSLLPLGRDFKAAIPYLLYDLKIRKYSPIWEGKYNPVQKIAYAGVIVLAFGSLLTGAAIYKPVQLGWLTKLLGGYKMARLEHFVCMIGFLIFNIIHLLQVIRSGWNNFRAMLAGYQIEKK